MLRALILTLDLENVWGSENEAQRWGWRREWWRLGDLGKGREEETMTINVGWELVNWRIVYPDYRGEARKGRGRRGNSGQGVGPISSACPWSQSRTGEAVRDLDGNCFRLFPYSRISSRPTRSELGKQHRRRGEPNANAKDLSWLGCMSGKHPVKQFPTQTSLVLTVLTPCNPARPACYSPAQPSPA